MKWDKSGKHIFADALDNIDWTMLNAIKFME